MADNNKEEVKEKKKKKSILKKNSIGEKRKSSDVGQDKVEDETPISENLTVDDQVKIVNHDDEQKSNEIESVPPANVVEPEPTDDGQKQAVEKTPMEIINDILNPPMPEFDPSKPYNVPTAVKAGDVNALQELDERKIIELKEAFLLFDLNGDGCIDEEDLRATFGTLGEDNIPEGLIEQMMSEAMNPLDFDAFVMLLGYKTIELDPEDVLLEALSKWDVGQTGLISEDKIRHDLICYGDRFTEKEAYTALEEAPIGNKNKPGEPPMIDYQGFCKLLGGLRKRKPSEN
ncbi:myosin regulatory light chain 10 [Bradysia coprophila]|uniref:myosin regulatory light chain 10 n=1 Tax=Bradysia coprophila TaxID=38358 RepID=UPI00187DC43E|nr:myosin regulatory light chain 10 [Bradysia coprophila]